MIASLKDRSALLFARALKRPLLVAALFAGILGPLVVFTSIAEDVHDGESLRWDTPLLHFIHGYASPAHDALIIAITNFGGARIVVPFCFGVVLIFLLLKQLRWALFYAAATGGAAVLNIGAKLLFGRPRPDLWVSPAPELDYGFPSGHSMISMAIALAFTTIAWPTRWRWPVMTIGALYVLTIGFTRLYLGVHYPSDVMGGWCASLVWVTGLSFIDRHISRRRNAV